MVYFLKYEVRSIQKYIYSSSKLKEIERASQFVSTILKKVLEEACDHFHYIYDKNAILSDDFQFDEKNFDFQIAFEGGGSLFCFLNVKEEEDIHKFNQFIGYLFLKETYSLRVCYAFVKKTDDINADRKNLNNKASKLKSRMPDACLQPSLPITMCSKENSFPLSEITKSTEGGDKPTVRKITRESKCKLVQVFSGTGTKNLEEIRDFGEDSMLGLVHIDVNDLGIAIKEFFEKNKTSDYCKAINLSRKVSNAINEKYNKAFNDFILEYPFSDNDKPYRIIINSGDDITFIIKGIYAIDVVAKFLKELNKSSFFDDEKKITACAGIAFIKSHFPYNKGYDIAEALCESAKRKAKKESGNYCAFDYYICQNGMISTVEEDEAKFKNLYSKPYFVNRGQHKDDDYEELIERIKDLASESMTISKIKEIRNAYEKGDDYIEMVMKRISSRLGEKHKLIPFDDNDKNHAKYYDASTLMDFYMPYKED